MIDHPLEGFDEIISILHMIRIEQMDSRGSKMLHKCIYPGELFSGVAFSKKGEI